MKHEPVESCVEIVSASFHFLPLSRDIWEREMRRRGAGGAVLHSMRSARGEREREREREGERPQRGGNLISHHVITFTSRSFRSRLSRERGHAMQPTHHGTQRTNERASHKKHDPCGEATGRRNRTRPRPPSASHEVCARGTLARARPSAVRPVVRAVNPYFSHFSQ